MTDFALINPQIISWARARAQVSEESLSQAMGVKVEKLISWEEGETKPTFAQAQKLANKLHIPFAFLFLPHPPDEPVPLPDLRTVGSFELGRASVDLLDTIRSVIRRQEWYKEYLSEQDAQPLPFIGSFTVLSDHQAVADDIRTVLGLTDLNPKGLTWDAYQREIISAAEDAGILVMRSGIVGSNTHRPLSIQEFRGFAISDPYAPVVFINLRDAPSARLFTLIHEIAHLWIGKSGISTAKANETRKEERFCNAVAGEFLAPTRLMMAHWSERRTIQENTSDIAKLLHVSRYVIARRALDLGFIGSDVYNEYYQQLMAEFNASPGAGGNYYASVQNKNSVRFSKALMVETLSGRVLLRDAGRLLGISPDKLKRYATEIGA
ncbi:ImmA/IrrE family metallo-endopeptidase [Yersinia enterocolitica]|uniref:XRE family transcriptional regulator n=1 Tax=Yersinia enterocolitica TaxID=630 RepID=UPI00155AE907|nr:XRE family transcriptional regulator [Yersinia enterocolitica]MBX9485819.1 ImmA/IrrE family metallo-endopeptidase [Yersinia enterocolitica]NQS96720.1 ImmA/IrrE family metallo-endopeptidase [Yersinia enterocolitica]NQT43397.1 ImmA/IrrE family metallo-endopeptidase [Yersinia enterocolitica]NQT98803.1 ImmA/IrrE family metallo-endopeptidase [Yersinia enterocolitica]HDM8448669.1 ImmA/IrrE family metallo-endopeptidase [Yersinia enterocolitica]